MGQATDMLGGMDILGIIVIILIFGAAFTIWYFRKAFKRAEVEESLKTAKNIQSYEKEQLRIAKKQGKKLVKSILGTGEFQCICFRPNQILDWTHIPMPIGECYQADTSCPMSGDIYIVRQLEDGNIVDYDPRKVPVILDQTPEYAWFATHWKIVQKVFEVPYSWLRNIQTWYAVGLMLIAFIVVMAAIGG